MHDSALWSLGPAEGSWFVLGHFAQAHICAHRTRDIDTRFATLQRLLLSEMLMLYTCSPCTPLD